MGLLLTAKTFSSIATSAYRTIPFRSRPILSAYRKTPTRSMADSSVSPFKKIQIQREDSNVLHSDVQACLQTFDAYVVGKEDAPGIVVLQEWWGVDFEIKNHALRISQINPNFKALIPDLYRGKVGLDVAEAQHLMEGLDWQGAIKDIRASVGWLKANGSQKVGVTGYCMGGALAIASSVLIPEVDAVVAFYGVPSPELADPSIAKAPVQAHFGELDSFVGFADITAAKSLEEKLKLSGVPSEVHIYPGVGHAFMNASPDGVKRRKEMGLNDENEDAAELAWSRFSSWMSRYLSP
ncbi:protein usf [Cinnamomum micranthum f. kanehirae]|uniref:Protein usf n=1 Tax=Cinnamomum micranthum f. kanehirae TaxID=337451 RepID=A0A443PE52_9MAGN|nr:protein usf [Cinnamomum micranthum f. kanehirae]